jgi:hypothetical protein
MFRLLNSAFCSLSITFWLRWCLSSVGITSGAFYKFKRNLWNSLEDLWSINPKVWVIFVHRMWMPLAFISPVTTVFRYWVISYRFLGDLRYKLCPMSLLLGLQRVVDFAKTSRAFLLSGMTYALFLDRLPWTLSRLYKLHFGLLTLSGSCFAVMI